MMKLQGYAEFFLYIPLHIIIMSLFNIPVYLLRFKLREIIYLFSRFVNDVKLKHKFFTEDLFSL